MSFLIKIRNKSNSEKNKILLISTVIVMIILFGVWYMLDVFFGSSFENTSSEESSNVLSGMSDVFVEFYENMTSAVDEIDLDLK